MRIEHCYSRAVAVDCISERALLVVLWRRLKFQFNRAVGWNGEPWCCGKSQKDCRDICAKNYVAVRRVTIPPLNMIARLPTRAFGLTPGMTVLNGNFDVIHKTSVSGTFQFGRGRSRPIRKSIFNAPPI